MGGKLTGFLGLLAIVGSGALANNEDDLTKTFAYCAGRFSAELEHAWLVGGSDADILEDRRAGALALLAALVGDIDTGRALDLRIRAKHAHARLLLDASFHTDPKIANRARRLSKDRIRACFSMLLG